LSGIVVQLGAGLGYAAARGGWGEGYGVGKVVGVAIFSKSYGILSVLLEDTMTIKTHYDIYTTQEEMDAYLARQEKEVDTNRDVFNKHLPRLLEEHRGKYMLMKNGEMFEVFDTWREAYEEGSKRFPDLVFSAPEITDFVYCIRGGAVDPGDEY